jgi:hypothetical protein
MKLVTAFVIPFLLSSQAALADSVDGNGALALAALVAGHSPNISASDKGVLNKLSNDEANVPNPSKKQIRVAADAVTCRASNVDIAAHSCELTFGAKKVAVEGMKAHELYATLMEVHVEPDGAAGTIFVAVSKLLCTIDPAGVKARDGSGAHCEFGGNPT